MHRAVLNIVTNAIDACHEREDGRVEVSTQYSHAERMARVAVVDNGSGIEPDDLEKIFAVFVSRKGGRGTGLGLPVSQKILEEHGGRIRVESTARRRQPLHARIPRHLATHRRHLDRLRSRTSAAARASSRCPPTARMPDAYLDADAIRAATFVRHVEIHDTLGSTNDRAAELARDADDRTCPRSSPPAIKPPAAAAATTSGGPPKARSHSACCSNQHRSASAPPTGRNFHSQPPSPSATRLQSN